MKSKNFEPAIIDPRKTEVKEEVKKSQKVHHYETKKDVMCEKGMGDSMTTHHSLIDESFCDILYEKVASRKVPKDKLDSEDGDDEFSEEEGP